MSCVRELECRGARGRYIRVCGNLRAQRSRGSVAHLEEVAECLAVARAIERGELDIHLCVAVLCVAVLCGAVLRAVL